VLVLKVQGTSYVPAELRKKVPSFYSTKMAKNVYFLFRRGPYPLLFVRGGGCNFEKLKMRPSLTGIHILNKFETENKYFILPESFGA